MTTENETSLPSRERGLKPRAVDDTPTAGDVAPFTGAWIETNSFASNTSRYGVAPFTGAWIETCKTLRWAASVSVAPFTGAWIETRYGFR